MQQNCKWRLSGDRDETIDHMISECRNLAQKEYKTRHVWVGKEIHWELCKKLKFYHTTKWYRHKPESVQENETHNILARSKYSSNFSFSFISPYSSPEGNTKNNPQSLGKGPGRVVNRRTSRDNPNYSIVNIGHNTGKSSGNLRLAITQTPVNNHQLTLVRRNLERHNNEYKHCHY